MGLGVRFACSACGSAREWCPSARVPRMLERRHAAGPAPRRVRPACREPASDPSLRRDPHRAGRRAAQAAIDIRWVWEALVCGLRVRWYVPGMALSASFEPAYACSRRTRPG